MATESVRQTLTGRGVERLEDASLLSGRGRFADDYPIRANTAHAAVLRSPHAHAEVLRVDPSEALASDGVITVVTGEDARHWSAPFIVSVRQSMEHWCLATDRVRYMGEPVAVVVAEDRYKAEDALDLIHVDYRPLPAVIDPQAAAAVDATVLHPAVGSNVVSARDFRYGDPEAAFAAVPHRIGLTVRYPRNACTPIEGYVVVAEYDPCEQTYDAFANFQGPFSLHPVMAQALKVPGNRFRLRTPRDSGGSFGIKQAVFPYVVAMCLAARKAGRPVKWVEDRLEHLLAASSATGRVTRIEAAVMDDGEILALSYDQLEDCGAYLRAPEPASLYRMHGVMTGAYKVPALSVANRVVLTNKTPSGLNRGFGGPQMYFALERLMQRIATELDLEPLTVIRRNLVPADAFPYRAPAGALLDSGDYQAAVERAAAEGGLEELEQRREQARAEGRLYGIGFAAVVEPSISNMGYITTVLTPEERRRAGSKNGAVATATVALDPTGAATVSVASTPQGQGHCTVLAQVVADVLGIALEDVRVEVELDTLKDAWSIAAGNYSSRFSGAVAGAAHLAATRLKDKLARIASQHLNVTESGLAFADGTIFAADNPANAVPLRHIAGIAHWSPGTLPEGMDPSLRETAFWTMPQLEPPDEGDRINSSGAYGLVFDFCGVEVDRDTGHVRIDKYVTMHDPGRILNPALLDGQIRGGFAHAVGAALFEEFAYSEDGSFLSGTFADYLVPTACEVPDPVILHMETPSPFTPLGAKGVGEGNCMSTPVCLANAVADALGAADVALPLTPARVATMIHGKERGPSNAAAPREGRAKGTEGRALQGEGTTTVPAGPEEVWGVVLDAEALARVIPGCHELAAVGEHSYRAEVTMGVGPVKGRFTVTVDLFDLDPPRALTLAGTASGPLGSSAGRGRIELEAADGGTRVRYRYEVELGGKIAAVGGRMLDGATRFLIGQFFERLAAVAAGKEAPAPTWWQRLLRWLGIAR